MHTQRVMLLAVAAVGLVSAFLPWLTIIVGVSGMDTGQGWIVLAIFGAALAAIVAGNRRMAPTATTRGLVAVLGAGAAGFGIWKLVQIKNGNVEIGDDLADLREIRTDGRMEGLFKDLFEVGVGIYVLIGAGALLAILAIMRRKSTLMPG